MRLMRFFPWPLPALLSWAAAWALFTGSRGLGDGWALLLGASAGALLALLQPARWRRVMVALGFPVSLLTLATALPSWAWLLPLLLLVLVYPASTWRDAPLFPTPAGALQSLPELAPLAVGADVLDAGCGLGHGLHELHRVYPHVRLRGIEWSRPLATACRWRCPWAQVERGDMWALDWRGFAMVYLFQRPESMPRVWDKARAELAPEAWLVSLDFEVEGQLPRARVELPHGHSLWIYRPCAKDALLPSS
jgi:hypothetical protein